jgi:hypothetical protein
MRHYLRQAGNNGRRRVLVLALVISFGGALLTSASAGAGGRAGFGCAPRFDIGEVTLEESLALPRLQAGLDAGAFTASDIAALFVAIDHNGDGILCFQDVGALTGAGYWQYFYNGVDNNASVPAS